MAWLALALVPVAWIGAALALIAWGTRDPRGCWDAIVVAGAAVRPGGRPSPALVRRTRHAVARWRAGGAPRIVFTGGVGAHPPAEARLAADLARAEGVPDDAVVLEDRSRTTEENARFSAELLGDVRVLVVSDSWHLFRCVHAFRRHFARVDGSGASVPPGVALRWSLREVWSVLLYAASGRLR